jgi:hypothetical protein
MQLVTYSPGTLSYKLYLMFAHLATCICGGVTYVASNVFILDIIIEPLF